MGGGPGGNRWRRLRSRRTVLTILLVVAALAALAWLNRPRDEATRATVDDAVRSFRSQGAEGGDGPRPLGVYRYATRGSESVRNVFVSTTHDYDGVSTVVLSEGRCGEVERWQVLQERWTELESCPGPKGDRLARMTEFHEFFGIEQKDAFRCTGRSMSGPPRRRPGVRFSSSCRSDGSAAFSAARVVGLETVSLAGRSFPALRTESRSRLEGSFAGVTRRQDWRRRSDGLLLRRVVSTEARLSVAGGTDYAERYAIELLDPRPRR